MNNRQGKPLTERILSDVLHSLDLNYLIKSIIDKYIDKGSSLSSITLHADPHSDLLSYEDLQYLSFLCEGNNLSLSSTIGVCEANRDLYELASLNVSSIQVPSVESSFAFNKFKTSYSHVYNTPISRVNPSVDFHALSPSALTALINTIKESPFSQSIIIDRNTLLKYFKEEDEYLSIFIKDLSKSNHNISLTLCGGIEPRNANKLISIYNCQFLSTRMFRVRLSTVKPITLLPSLLSDLLILEVQVLNAMLNNRSFAGNRLSSRLSSIVNYAQYSMLSLPVN